MANPFISLPINLTETAAALQGIQTQLVRIGNILERLAPPLADEPERGQPASLSDLRRTDFDSVQKVKRELAVFAANNNVTLDSDAFVRSIIEYEREIVETYGSESIKELPWNKAAGGLIFTKEATKESAQVREGAKA